MCMFASEMFSYSLKNMYIFVLTFDIWNIPLDNIIHFIIMQLQGVVEY